MYKLLKEEFVAFQARFGRIPKKICPTQYQRYCLTKLAEGTNKGMQDVITHKFKLAEVAPPPTPIEPLAAQAVLHLRFAVKQLPLWAASPTVRLLFGGWPFSARFGSHDVACRVCGAVGGDSLTHCASCPVVLGWAGLVFGPRAPAVLPPSPLGLFGCLVPALPDDQARYALFLFGLWETWTAVKHGAPWDPSPARCRQRLRHCAVRSPQVAKWEALIPP